MKNFLVRALCCCLLTALAACSPRLDWREARPTGAGALALFPCKPEIESREQNQGGHRLVMGLAACKAGGQSFSLAWADVAEPAQVGPALEQMRLSLAQRLQARAAAPRLLRVPGMTPHPLALQQALQAEGQQAQVAVFARGLKVYQAVMLGPKPDMEAWETFVAALKLDL